MGSRELIALMATLMALNALTIDTVLPALPAIGDAFSITNANDRQYLISFFLLGMGGGALIYLAFGRSLWPPPDFALYRRALYDFFAGLLAGAQF